MPAVLSNPGDKCRQTPAAAAQSRQKCPRAAWALCCQHGQGARLGAQIHSCFPKHKNQVLKQSLRQLVRSFNSAVAVGRRREHTGWGIYFEEPCQEPALPWSWHSPAARHKGWQSLPQGLRGGFSSTQRCHLIREQPGMRLLQASFHLHCGRRCSGD